MGASTATDASGQQNGNATAPKATPDSQDGIAASPGGPPTNPPAAVTQAEGAVADPATDEVGALGQPNGGVAGSNPPENEPQKIVSNPEPASDVPVPASAGSDTGAPANSENKGQTEIVVPPAPVPEQAESLKDGDPHPKQDGGSLQKEDGGSLQKEDGGSLQKEGGSLQKEGGSLQKEDGGSLQKEDGGSLQTEDGGSLQKQDDGSQAQKSSSQKNQGGFFCCGPDTKRDDPHEDKVGM